MWRTWASPDEPRATLQRTTRVRCIAPCFKTHTHLIHSSPYPHPKKTPDVLWWVIEWEGLYRKVWRLSHLILDVHCLTLPIGLVHFFSRSLTILYLFFIFLSGMRGSCSYIFLWTSSLTSNDDTLTGSWRGFSQLHMFSMAKVGEL